MIISLNSLSIFYKLRAQKIFKTATSINYVGRFICGTSRLRVFLRTAATCFGLRGFVHGHCEFATS
jgi:hypothetical protein